jgi:hypothetical protein
MDLRKVPSLEDPKFFKQGADEKIYSAFCWKGKKYLSGKSV